MGIKIGRKADPKWLPGQIIASTIISAPVAIVANNTYYTQAQILVPAGSPAHDIEVVGGVLFNVITGTQPLKTTLPIDIAIFDELNALLLFNRDITTQHTDVTSKTESHTVPAAIPMPATAVDKTYTLQVRGNGIAVNGASVNISAGGVFPARTFRAVARP